MKTLRQFSLALALAVTLTPASAPSQDSGVIDVFQDQGELPSAPIVVESDGSSSPSSGTVSLGEEESGPWKPPKCSKTRTTEDRADDSSRPQVRVMYVVPKDGKDERLDVNGKICRSIQAQGKWFADQAEGRSLRFDTFGGQLDVGFLRLDKTDAEIVGRDGGSGIKDGPTWIHHRIAREMDLAPNKIYAVYYAGSTKWRCGSAPHPPDVPGQVAGVYLTGHPKGQHACSAFPWGNAKRPQYIEFLMLHEIVHTLGFVRSPAPNSYDSAHVFDEGSKHPERDLMYSPRSDKDPTWNTGHRDGLIIDVGRDDYYADLMRSAYLYTPTRAVTP